MKKIIKNGIVLSLLSIQISLAATYEFENLNGENTYQITNFSGTILTTGTIQILYRTSGSDTDTAITDPSSTLDSYVSSNFANITFAEINYETSITPFSTFSYYAFTVEEEIVASDMSYGNNPYLYYNSGTEAMLYKFDDFISDGAGVVDFSFTLGDSNDAGSALIGAIVANSATINGSSKSTYSLASIDSAVVPEPSSMLLIGSGLLTLVARRKR